MKKIILVLCFMMLANVSGFGGVRFGGVEPCGLNAQLNTPHPNFWHSWINPLAPKFCPLPQRARGLFSNFGLGNPAFAGEIDYKQIYLNLPVPSFSYVHGVDPGQYYDNKDAAYSIYPLFRLSSPIYFKSVTIMPGYYDLTPVVYKGSNYLLFKEASAVKYTIPVYQKELVPEDFYDTHLPKQKYTNTQRISLAFHRFLGKHFKCSQRKPPVKSYLEVTDLDNNFVSVVVYYGNYRYYTLFRTIAF